MLQFRRNSSPAHDIRFRGDSRSEGSWNAHMDGDRDENSGEPACGSIGCLPVVRLGLTTRCCLLTNHCLCLLLQSVTLETTGSEVISRLDTATRRQHLRTGLKPYHTELTDMSIRSGLLQQVCRCSQEGHAYLRTDWPQPRHCNYRVQQARKCRCGRARSQWCQGRQPCHEGMPSQLL